MRHFAAAWSISTSATTFSANTLVAIAAVRTFLHLCGCCGALLMRRDVPSQWKRRRVDQCCPRRDVHHASSDCFCSSWRSQFALAPLPVEVGRC
ncbi:MAG: hypothetical protein KatS3mg111_2808 [Pirellulaceae bacterium]|nr:MAG: hypothetical protein KatS3mg111_2808 [Pirellulaceae bacterium]